MKKNLLIFGVIAAAAVVAYLIFRPKNAANSIVGPGSPAAVTGIRPVGYDSGPVLASQISNSISQLLGSFSKVFGGSNETMQPALGSPALPVGYGVIPITSGGSYEGAPTPVTTGFANIFGLQASDMSSAGTNFIVAGPVGVSDTLTPDELYNFS